MLGDPICNGVVTWDGTEEKDSEKIVEIALPITPVIVKDYFINCVNKSPESFIGIKLMEVRGVENILLDEWNIPLLSSAKRGVRGLWLKVAAKLILILGDNISEGFDFIYYIVEG